MRETSPRTHTPLAGAAALAVAAALSAGCNDAGTEILYDIDHFRLPCDRDGLTLCMRLREPQRDWEREADDAIQGFEPEWGVEYRVRVREKKRLTGGAGSGTFLELDTVLKEEEVPPGTQFSYAFDPNRPESITVDGAGGTLLDGRAYVCEPATVCDEITASIQSNGTVTVLMTYADPLSDPLVATVVNVN